MKKHILIVEDEEALAEMLQVVLEDEGYDVITASNGREGLSYLTKVRPALILSDVMMPIINGIQLLQAVHSDEQYRSIPFVLMSAAARANVELASPAPAAFLSKPFELTQLIDVVEQFAGRP